MGVGGGRRVERRPWQDVHYRAAEGSDLPVRNERTVVDRDARLRHERCVLGECGQNLGREAPSVGLEALY